MGNLWNIKTRYKAVMNNEIRGERGVAAGGFVPGASNVIDYVTISTTGNSTDFGNLITARGRQPSGFGNHIRGCVAGGNGAPARLNSIEYITIATTGNASDF